MYKLYYSPGACSLAVHALLAEINKPFELIRTALSEGANREAGYLALNSRGQVPVLIDDAGNSLKESLSILVYLCEKYDSPRLPSEVSAKQKIIEQLAYYNSTLHQSYSFYFLFKRKVAKGEADASILPVLIKKIQNIWKLIEDDMEKRLSPEINIADFLLAVIYNWKQEIPSGLHIGIKTTELCKRVISLPCFQKAMAAEEIKHILS